MSCPTFCDPMDRSTPGLPVPHHLPEFAQTHVCWVSDAIQPSHPLSPPSPPALNFPQYQGLFQWVGSLRQVAKVLELQLQHPPFNDYSGLIFLFFKNQEVSINFKNAYVFYIMCKREISVTQKSRYPQVPCHKILEVTGPTSPALTPFCPAWPCAWTFQLRESKAIYMGYFNWHWRPVLLATFLPDEIGSERLRWWPESRSGGRDQDVGP